MEQQSSLTRDDLVYPGIRKHEGFWLFVSDFAGAVAMWAIKQSPYAVPDNLATVIEKLSASMVEDFNEVGMRQFDGVQEIERYVSEKLRAIPEYMLWNERKNGNDAPYKFSTRYDGPGEPDDDFIDLGALEHNVATTITRLEIIDRG